LRVTAMVVPTPQGKGKGTSTPVRSKSTRDLPKRGSDGAITMRGRVVVL